MNDTFVGMALQALDDEFDKTLKEPGLWSYVKDFLIGVAMGFIDLACLVGSAVSIWGIFITIKDFFKRGH